MTTTKAEPAFQREDRYMVIKRSDLASCPVHRQIDLSLALEHLSQDLPDREYLVIESDWPEYEPVWQMIERRMTGAVLADPVPPAGGEPEVLACIYHGDDHDGKVGLLWRYMPKPDGFSLKFELVDRAHVTRLQAEVDELKVELNNARRCRDTNAADSKFLQKERSTLLTNLSNSVEKSSDLRAEIRNQHMVIETLQSELTKAREELDTLKDAVHHALDDSEEDAQTGQVTIYRTDFDKLIELVPEEWHDRYHNQSAPADKSDDDWHMNPCKQGHRDVGAAGGVAHCYTCDEKIEAATTQEAFECWNATHPVAKP